MSPPRNASFAAEVQRILLRTQSSTDYDCLQGKGVGRATKAHLLSLGSFSRKLRTSLPAAHSGSSDHERPQSSHAIADSQKLMLGHSAGGLAAGS